MVLKKCSTNSSALMRIKSKNKQSHRLNIFDILVFVYPLSPIPSPNLFSFEWLQFWRLFKLCYVHCPNQYLLVVRLNRISGWDKKKIIYSEHIDLKVSFTTQHGDGLLEWASLSGCTQALTAWMSEQLKWADQHITVRFQWRKQYR